MGDGPERHTGRALVATAGAEGIRLRSIGQDGDVIEGDTLVPTPGRRAVSPVIATRAGEALVAWIEPEVPLVQNDRAQVVVVKVDENGKRITGQRINDLHSEHQLTHITNLALAISDEHFLVVISASSIPREPMEGESATRETWTTTHSLDLARESPISHYLASPMRSLRGACHDGCLWERLRGGLRGQGQPLYGPFVPLRHGDPHALVPHRRSDLAFALRVDHPWGRRGTRFPIYARSNPTALTSEIVNTRCTEPPATNGISCGTETVLFRSTKRIRRAWVGGQAGGSGLSHALFSWQEWDDPKARLSVARLNPNNPNQEKAVALFETFGEAFFIAPNRLLNAVYLMNPNPAEPATLKDAYVQPLCFLDQL